MTKKKTKQEVKAMTKTSVKIKFGRDEDHSEKMAQVLKVFGTTEESVICEFDDSTIEMPGGITATYTTEIEDIEGYDLLKEYIHTVNVESLGKNFKFTWTNDYGPRALCSATVHKLIGTGRSSGARGMSLEDRETLKLERARYIASKRG